MPRYFFDITDGQEIRDRDGSELADLDAARLEAIRYAGEVLREMPERFWHAELWTMTVKDARKVPLFTLKFLAEPAPALTPPLALTPAPASATD